MKVSEIIKLARQHSNEGSMVSSAQLCLSDAVEMQRLGHPEYARKRALKSLAYSVGMFHPDYQRAAE